MAGELLSMYELHTETDSVISSGFFFFPRPAEESCSCTLIRSRPRPYTLYTRQDGYSISEIGGQDCSAQWTSALFGTPLHSAGWFEAGNPRRLHPKCLENTNSQGKASVIFVHWGAF